MGFILCLKVGGRGGERIEVYRLLFGVYKVDFHVV